MSVQQGTNRKQPSPNEGVWLEYEQGSTALHAKKRGRGLEPNKKEAQLPDFGILELGACFRNRFCSQFHWSD
jgi:hypothetical protein